MPCTLLSAVSSQYGNKTFVAHSWIVGRKKLYFRFGCWKAWRSVILERSGNVLWNLNTSGSFVAITRAGAPFALLLQHLNLPFRVSDFEQLYHKFSYNNEFDESINRPGRYDWLSWVITRWVLVATICHFHCTAVPDKSAYSLMDSTWKGFVRWR